MSDSPDGKAAKRPQRIPGFLEQRRDEIARQFKLDDRTERIFLADLLSGDVLRGEAGPPLLLPGDVLPPGASWNELVRALRSWWLVRLLREASREGDSEAFEWILRLILGLLGVAQPPGKGRPQVKIYQLMHKRWSESGKPQLTGPVCDGLAADLDPEAFSEAKKNGEWRSLRSRIAAGVKRVEKRCDETLSSRD
jgi:hypothetical protein